MQHAGLLECIQPGYAYPRSEDVHVARWKDVDSAIKAWALEIWSHAFSTVRTPLHDQDYLIWIDGSATLVAKPGVLSAFERSTRMVYVTLNYVIPDKRGMGLAGKMILSMAHDLSKELSKDVDDVKFMFELHDVPRSMSTAVPFTRFSYVWVPFFATETWAEVSAPVGIPGFRPDHWAGFQFYTAGGPTGGNRIVIDPHDTVVWYDSFDSLVSFDKRAGAYVRMIWPLGNVCVYVENTSFTDTTYEHLLLI